MRLVCPNCDANYEVDEGVIPDAGRDVQCSSCGQTWFQDSAEDDFTASEDDLDLEDITPDPETVEAATVDTSDDGATNDDGPAPQDSEADDSPSHETDGDDHQGALEDEDSDQGNDDAPQRRELDDAVLNILREEAEHETRARTQDGGDFESQPDLTLEGGGSPQDSIRDRTARLRGEEVESGTRRDLLPDIEEINSTLRATSDREEEMDEDGDATVQPRQGGSFRRGFLLIILLFVLASLLYVYAPKISASVPAMEGTMNGYVGLINNLRVWLDGLMGNAVEAMSGFSENGGG